MSRETPSPHPFMMFTDDRHMRASTNSLHDLNWPPPQPTAAASDNVYTRDIVHQFQFSSGAVGTTDAPPEQQSMQLQLQLQDAVMHDASIDGLGMSAASTASGASPLQSLAPTATTARLPPPPTTATTARLPPPPTTAPAKRSRGRPKGRPAAKATAKVVVHNPKQATVTSKTGTQLTLYQYQQFQSREQGKLFIRAFALAQGKRVVIDRTVSGGSNIVFVCKSATPCPFKVRLLRSKKKGAHVFYVTTLETDHGDACSGKVPITKKQVLQDIRAASETNTTLTLTGSEAQSIVETIQTAASALGASTSTAAAHVRATAHASVVVRTGVDDVMSDVDKLQALLAQFQLQNPTSSIQVDTYSPTALHRAFLKLPLATPIQQLSARILGFDTTTTIGLNSMGSVTFELAAKDGNNDAYTLAVALCDAPTAENYAWFFNCCLSSGLVLDVPIFCDRSLPVLTAVESLPVRCLLVQSTPHLLATIARDLGGVAVPKDVETLVHRAQAADTYDEFDALLTTIQSKHRGVADHLRRLDPSVWAKHCYVRKCVLYGAQSPALGANAGPGADTTVHARSPLSLFQSYMERSMHAIYERKRRAKHWARTSQLLTPYAERLQDEQRARCIACRVTPNDDETGSAYVWDTKSPVPKRRRVNVSAHACSCAFADQFGLPCKHLIAAAKYFNSNGGLWDLTKLCHPMYLTRAHVDVFSHATAVSMPLEEELAWSTSVQVVSVGPSNRCSRCHLFGHNKRRCPNAPAAASGASSGSNSDEGDSA